MKGVYQTLKFGCERIFKGNLLLRNFFYVAKTNLSLFSVSCLVSHIYSSHI